MKTKQAFDKKKFWKGMAWLVIPMALMTAAAFLDTLKAGEWTALIAGVSAILRAIVDYVKHSGPTAEGD